MGKLTLHTERLTPEAEEALIRLCPFGAISREDGSLAIGAGCRMCRLCVKKGGGAVTEEADAPAAGVDKSAWRGVAVFCEQHRGEIHPVSFELLGKARSLADAIDQPVYALLIGSGMADAAKALLLYGADEVHVYDQPQLYDYREELYASAMDDFIEAVKPSSVLVGATNMGRSLAPRVAARRRTGLTADCTKLEMKPSGDLTQIRPAFGGNIMAQIVTPRHRPQFATVRYKVFSAPKPTGEARGIIVPHALSPEKLLCKTEVLDVREKPREVDISEAETIVAVGRGLRSKADIALAQSLADALDAQLASTRPLVEAGWFDPKRQIGLSGRTVNAKLIVTLGVSGSVQFAAGMKGSETIVAVNSDPRAPIFDVAHHGFVGDLYEVVPRLLKRIEGRRGA